MAPWIVNTDNTALPPLPREQDNVKDVIGPEGGDCNLGANIVQSTTEHPNSPFDVLENLSEVEKKLDTTVSV